jgi:hypothetical protein
MEAIWSGDLYSPDFLDIHAHDNGNANTRSSISRFGGHDANDTALDGKTFFTGSVTFTVKKIEVLGVAGETAVPLPARRYRSFKKSEPLRERDTCRISA